MNKIQTLSRLAALALLSIGASAQAFEQKLSGFGTVAAGQTWGSCTQGAMAAAYDDGCTRMIVDWAHAGVYNSDPSIRPETRVGVQWTGTFTDSLSATAQGVGRMTAGTKAGLEWAFLTDKLTSSWTLQVGRKRLPLYYFSDFQDAGYAYNMVRPSPDVYGWDVVNYNGANLDWSSDVGEWAVHTSVYGGGENSRKNRYSTLVSDDPLDVKWKDIVGGSVEVSREWLTLRASYTQSKIEVRDRVDGQLQTMSDGTNTGKQDFYGVAAIVDYGDWLGRAEVAATDRTGQGYRAKFGYINVGRRIGAFTSTLQYSQYFESSTIGDGYTPEHNKTASVAVRYELNKFSDLKLQYDRDIDTTRVRFAGSANALTLACDFVF